MSHLFVLHWVFHTSLFAIWSWIPSCSTASTNLYFLRTSLMAQFAEYFLEELCFVGDCVFVAHLLCHGLFCRVGGLLHLWWICCLLLLRIEYSCDILPDLISLIKENDDMSVKRLLEAILTLDNLLNERKEAALRVIPGVCSQLLIHRIEWFDDEANAEVEVVLRTVEGPNDKVYDAEVKACLCRLCCLLLLFNWSYELLCFSTLLKHDVADT